MILHTGTGTFESYGHAARRPYSQASRKVNALCDLGMGLHDSDMVAAGRGPRLRRGNIAAHLVCQLGAEYV